MDFRKYLVEFIGTFLFVFVIGMVVVAATIDPSKGMFAPIAIGVALMVMVYAGGHISGAHYNPAVTLGVFLRGKCSAQDIVPYMLAQCVGAAVAGFAVMFLCDMDAFKSAVEAAAAPAASVVNVLIAEVIGTFALVWVVLNVATSKASDGNSFYGLAIGFVVTAMAYAVGGISGGVFNPAVAVGVCVMGIKAWPDIWMFLAANFAAGVLAAVLFKVCYAGDDE